MAIGYCRGLDYSRTSNILRYPKLPMERLWQYWSSLYWNLFQAILSMFGVESPKKKVSLRLETGLEQVPMRSSLKHTTANMFTVPIK